MSRSGGRRPRVVVSIFDHRDYSGGGPVVVGGIVRQLAADYDVVLVTPNCRVDTAGMRAGVKVISLPIGWAGPRVGQMLYLPLVLLVALVIRHDLWIESFTPPFSSSFLPIVTRRPVIGLAQALSAREMARKYGMTFLLSIERFALRRYRHVVVLNPFDRQVVEECNPRAAVHLIPNIITVPAAPPQDPERSRSSSPAPAPAPARAAWPSCCGRSPTGYVWSDTSRDRARRSCSGRPRSW
jgi:hypothetical protein